VTTQTAQLAGFAVGGLAVAAIGSRAALTFRGTLQPDNIVEVATFRIEGPTAQAAYAGKVGQNTLTGTVQAALSDMAVFSDIAGRPLAGSITAKANLSGDPARKAVTADIDLRTRALALGLPALDRLLGQSPHFRGRLSQIYDGYTFEGARLDGVDHVVRRAGDADGVRSRGAIGGEGSKVSHVRRVARNGPRVEPEVEREARRPVRAGGRAS